MAVIDIVGAAAGKTRAWLDQILLMRFHFATAAYAAYYASTGGYLYLYAPGAPVQ